MTKNTIAIIGSGNMGTSLLGGLIADGVNAEQIWISDPDNTRLAALHKQFSVRITQNNREAVDAANVVILAIKPQTLLDVIAEVSDLIQQRKSLIISIAAGVRESTIQHKLGGDVAIVRCMPNTPALIGSGASALYANEYVTHAQRNQAESILRAVGIVVWLNDEKLMDVVTALSGSGPAYFFLVMEVLQQAAEELGLPKETARLLTLQTALGSARMAIESEDTLTELRHRVTSPGGTTEQALRVLQNKNIQTIFSDALKAAQQRSEELGYMLEKT